MTFAEQVAIRTLWGECRGEPEEGQRAVAHVLWNRLADGRWGANFAAVCLAPLQFSCWNASDRQRAMMAALPDDDVLLQNLRDVLKAAASANDPTGGALFYYSNTMVTPPTWAGKMRFLREVGHHRFFTDRP